jgi:selenocysteine-specific elongation factor
VLLVVAADEGWMPQTAEHVDALAALGVRHGLLVVTRADLLDPALALEEARDRLAHTPLADVPDLAVSAATGEGLPALRSALDALVAQLPAPDPDADARLWIDRAFTIRGAGTVVTGTLGPGRLRTGDELELVTEAGPRRVAVRALQSLGEPVEEATGVARVAVNLRGLPREAVGRGDALLTAGAWLAVGTLDARLCSPTGDAVDPRELPAELILHIGSAATAVRLRPLGPDTVRLRLRRSLPLRIGDRALLRDPGRRRIAAGLDVLDVRPPELRRRGAAAARGRDLAGTDGAPSAAEELARRGLVRASDLVAMGVPAPDVAALGPPSSGWLVDGGRAAAAAAALVEAVARHDAADPLDPGLPLEAARRAAGLPDARLVDVVVRAAGAPLVLRGGRVAAARDPGLPAGLRAALEALRAELAADPFAAPDADRLAELGLDQRGLATLVRAGELLRIADGVVLLPGADARALRILSGLGPEFTLSEARQALRTSRRVAVPLLELLGRTGRTARTPDGHHRLAGAAPT